MKRVVLCVCFILSTHGLSAENEVTVVTELMPPYQKIVNGKVDGLATRIIKQVLTCADIQADIQLLPWKRAYFTALYHKNTLIYSMARIPPREQQFFWIGTLFDTSIILYKLKGREDIVIKNFEDIKKYRLGLLRSGFITSYFIHHGFKPGKDFSFYEEESSKIPMLQQRRFDLIDGNPLFVRIDNKSNQSNKLLEPVYTLKHHQQLYLAANKNSDLNMIKKIKICLKKVSVNRSSLSTPTKDQ